MKRYATLKDVALLAGTTAATVSYVLNEKQGRYISEETRKKVVKAAKKLDYIKCNGASSLKGKERKLVALLVPHFDNQFFTRIIIASEERLVTRGYDLVICNTFDNPKREKDIIRRMLQQRVDGILLIPTEKGAENTDIVRRLGIKMVVVDRQLEGVDTYSAVSTDNYEAGYKAAAYLMEKGHKDIAFIGWNTKLADLGRRRDAVLDAAKKYRIPLKNILVKEEGDSSADDGYRLTAEVLDNHPQITAILYGFNTQALGGVKCLTHRGVDIPKSKSIVIIGSPEWAVLGKNNFTHINTGEYEVGKKAADLLFSMIKVPDKDGDKHTFQECNLVEGDSVLAIK